MHSARLLLPHAHCNDTLTPCKDEKAKQAGHTNPQKDQVGWNLQQQAKHTMSAGGHQLWTASAQRMLHAVSQQATAPSGALSPLLARAEPKWQQVVQPAAIKTMAALTTVRQTFLLLGVARCVATNACWAYGRAAVCAAAGGCDLSFAKSCYVLPVAAPDRCTW